jgi:hypothetical protein
VSSASLFDQRKVGNEAKRRRRDPSVVVAQELEMAQFDDEIVPLTNDAVAVI